MVFPVLKKLVNQIKVRRFNMIVLSFFFCWRGRSKLLTKLFVYLVSVYGIVVLCFIALSFLVGLATVFCIKGEAENYFVAGRSLPLWVVTCTLASQSIDSNAILGNVDLSYKYHFFDGFALPFGLGLSLILNGIFLAKHINLDGAKTLPDVYAKRYGKVVEVMVSIATIISFLCLLAGNLVGMGVIIEYLMGWSQQAAIWGSAAMVLAYTIAGGLYSVAYTDVMQATVGWIGCTALAFYMIANSELSAPQQSIGFPGYMYPDDEACALYDGVNCTFDESACCYNEEKYGSGGMDNGAYPVAPDAPVFPKQMTDPHSMSPFPNVSQSIRVIFALIFLPCNRMLLLMLYTLSSNQRPSFSTGPLSLFLDLVTLLPWTFKLVAWLPRPPLLL